MVRHRGGFKKFMKTQIVLLAAGGSTRFNPFSGSHKSMFVVCGKPIIGWTLKAIQSLEIESLQVIVVVGSNDKNIMEYLKGYKDLDIQIVTQDKPLGMGNALLCAKDLLGEKYMVAFPHFVNPEIFKVAVSKMDQSDFGIFTEKTEEPWKYGILSFDKKGEPNGIIEKPQKGKEPSDQRVIGCYILDSNFTKLLGNSPQSEYQFEEALDGYIKTKKLDVFLTKSLVMPLKYPWDIFGIKDFVLGNLPEFISERANISPNTLIKGKVFIEDGAIISDYSIVEGPVYIGKNAVVGAYCILRDKSVLGEGAQIERYVDCTRTIIGEGSHIHSGFLGDSVVGNGVRIGAGFVTGNKRIDRGGVYVKVKGERVASNEERLGTFIGDSVKSGINVSMMPGVVVGKRAVVGPGTIVLNNVDEDTLIYSEFVTNVKKINT